VFEFYEFQSSSKSFFQFNILLSPLPKWLNAEHIWTIYKTSICHNLVPTHKLLIYEPLITASVTCMVPGTDHLADPSTVFISGISSNLWSWAWIKGCMYRQSVVRTNHVACNHGWPTPQTTSPNKQRLRKVGRMNCTTIYTWNGPVGCCIQQRCSVGCNINTCRFSTQILCFFFQTSQNNFETWYFKEHNLGYGLRTICTHIQHNRVAVAYPYITQSLKESLHIQKVNMVQVWTRHVARVT